MPFVGDALESITDILLDLAEDQLREEVERVLAELKAEGLWPE